MFLIPARDAIAFFASPQVMLDNLKDGNISFYIKYPNGNFSGKLTELYDRRYRDFYKEIDEYYFEYKELNSYLYHTSKHLAINVVCDGKNCPKSGTYSDISENGYPITITNSMTLSPDEVACLYTFLNMGMLIDLVKTGKIIPYRRVKTEFINNELRHELVYDHNPLMNDAFEGSYFDSDVIFIKEQIELFTRQYGIEKDGKLPFDKRDGPFAEIASSKNADYSIDEATINQKDLAPVNADRWKKSLEAALKTQIEVLRDGKEDWTKDEIRDLLKNNYKDYLIEALNMLWQSIPADCKKGAGRPKKKSENPKNSENPENWLDVSF